MCKLYFLIMLSFIVVDSSADSRGRVSGSSSFDDSATICMSIGLQASLTGLENIMLETNQISGSAGAIYAGEDAFYVEANGQVRVLIEGGVLQNGGYEVPVQYAIDNNIENFLTEGEGAYSNEHILQARARIGTVSSQLAGDYSGVVTLIVTPAIGGLAGCGQSTYQYPSQSVWGTLAWEDLYPNAGDADYNDMVVNFRIEEHYNANNELETIEMDFIPIARGAGYNHALLMSLDGVLDDSNNVITETAPVYTGDAEISATYTNLNTLDSYTEYFNSGEDIVVFSDTREAAGSGFTNVYPGRETEAPDWMTSIEVSLTSGASYSNGGLISGEFNYRPYLSVYNTDNEIDIYQVNQNDGMIDGNGYPFGIMVPEDWAWPSERSSIDLLYPYFSEYRAWLAGDAEEISEFAKYWYEYPNPGNNANYKYYDLENLDI
ncbi:MAG: LruC domain-containing protein [Agarilytica sp.]